MNITGLRSREGFAFGGGSGMGSLEICHRGFKILRGLKILGSSFI